MSFNANIPQVTDIYLQSGSQIRANFQAINAAFNTNHVGLTEDSSISGMHNVLTLRPQSDDPTTSSSQTAIYCKLANSIPQLFFRPNSNQTAIQLTYPSISTGLNNASPPEYLTQQYSFLAGPFIIYGGQLSNVSNGTIITLSPGTTLLYVDLTVIGIGGSSGKFFTAATTNITGTSFTISTQDTLPNQNYYYMAVGK